MLSVRKFAMELSRMPEEEQKVAFDLRQTELNDLANDLRKRARRSWKKPSSFALSVLTAPLATAIKMGASLVGYEGSSNTDIGAYSYLFSAQARFGGY